MTLQRILQPLTSYRFKKTPRKEAARLFETMVHFYHIKLWYNPENNNLIFKELQINLIS
jgi:hypothetical protein